MQDKIAKVFYDAFGRTPLRQRMDDIFREVIEQSRFTDLANLKEETGDLLCSVLQLCTECDWKAEDLVDATLRKIEQRKLQYHSLGRKVVVGILGGSFNPPTLAHINLAKYVLNTSRTFDEVWILPCYNHMFGKYLEPPEHRLEMVRLACANDGRIKPCDYEIKNKLSSETYQTVKLLLEEDFAKGKYDFSWIIGLDVANSFNQWVNYEHLEKLIRFVVVPRDGVERDPSVDWYLKPPHIYLGDTNKEIGCMSSTFVRGTIKNMDMKALQEMGIDKYVDIDVVDYILKHNLYGIRS